MIVPMTALPTFALFPDSHRSTLFDLSVQLYEQQQRHWPMLSEGVNALDSVRTREVDCGEFSVRLQFNPKRIVSTGAKVDAASIKERKCFLCTASLPPEQRGVLVRGDYLVLCNPMPIFREHFTISHVDHIPQSIEESILPFLALTKDLSPRYSLFYNGPKCGASAPDHMHFQASPSGSIPAEKELHSRLRRIKTVGAVSVSLAEEYGRQAAVLEGAREQEMELTFLRLTTAMRNVLRTTEEPMMNVIGSYSDGVWRLIVFLRAKHRPAVFFHEGEAKVMVSPAAVDIGGLVVTPLEKDFLSLDRSMIKDIFAEVSVSRESAHAIIDLV